MYCRNCGNEVSEKAIMCVSCGTPPKSGTTYCHNCKAETSENAIVCMKCGVGLQDESKPSKNSSFSNHNNVESKRVAAGILALTLGGIGIHKFYLGYNSAGIMHIILALVITPIITAITLGFGAFIMFPIIFIIPLIEGIKYLTSTDESFINTYQINKKAWF